MIVVTDPVNGRSMRLHEIEWAVAQRMDGTRDLDWLVEYARGRHPKATREQIEQFLIHLAGHGLLERDSSQIIDDDEFSDSTTVDPAGGSWVVANVSGESSMSIPLKEVEVQEEVDTDDVGVVIRFPRAVGGTTQDVAFEANTDHMTALPDPGRLAPDDDSDGMAATHIDPGQIVSMPGGSTDLHNIALAPYVASEAASSVSEPNLQPPISADYSSIPSNLPVPSAPIGDSLPATAQPIGGLGLPSPLEEQPPWHVRPAVRRMRTPAVVAAAAVIAAFIPYPQYVTDECSVLPSSRAEVRAQVEGILSVINVDEGQHINAGDTLAELDGREIDATIQQAKAEAQSLTAKLEKMKHGSRPEEIARAEALARARKHDVDFAKNEADRRQRLFAQGVGSAEQRDNAKRDYEIQKSSLAQAQAELQLMRAGFRSEEIKVAEAELKGAQSQVAYLLNKRENLVIKSPINGVIMTPKFKEKMHSRVAVGDTVCEVADTSQVRVEISVPEQEIDLVQVGQPTVVKVKSLPLHPFMGEVSFIAPSVTREGEARFIRTVTVIKNDDGILHEGMTGYGEINTGRSTILRLALRKLIRWVRVRFLI